MQLIQNLPSLKSRVNHTTGGDSPHYILTHGQNIVILTTKAFLFRENSSTINVACNFSFSDTHSGADRAAEGVDSVRLIRAFKGIVVISGGQGPTYLWGGTVCEPKQ